MAKTINIKTVAEGVETPSQLEFLKMIDCDMIQGYIFSKPRPIKEFEQLLINQENNFLIRFLFLELQTRK